MRVINWNCNMTFRKKFEYIKELDADVMVIQECENQTILKENIGTQYISFWIGENRHKGLCVLIKETLVPEQLQVNPGATRFMLPIKIGNNFNLIAFWAMNDRNNKRQRYIAQVWSGLQQCVDYLSDHIMILGDFNWNASFDARAGSCKTLYGTMSDVVRLLNIYNIQSVYHTLNRIDHGKECDSTFYMYRNQNKGYHTDYVFLSEKLMNSTKSFQIGSFDEWGDKSDHMPIIIDFHAAGEIAIDKSACRAK